MRADGSVFLVSTIEAAKTVLQGRHDTEQVVRGEDDRLVVIVGCVQFIHDCRTGVRVANSIPMSIHPLQNDGIYTLITYIDSFFLSLRYDALDRVRYMTPVYAKLLKSHADQANSDIHIVMRVYLRNHERLWGGKAS